MFVTPLYWIRNDKFLVIGKNLSQDKTSSPSKVNDGGTLKILTFGQGTSQVCSTEKKQKDLLWIKAILLNTVWIENNQEQIKHSALHWWAWMAQDLTLAMIFRNFF